MNPFAIVGAVAAAGYGIYKAVTAQKEVPPAVEASLAQQAVPIAVQQINAGVPAKIAAQVAANAVVDAALPKLITAVNTDPRVDYWLVTWDENQSIPRTVTPQKAQYKSEAEANAKVAALTNPMVTGHFWATNVRVQKTTVQ
jgi:hypothetical protein